MKMIIKSIYDITIPVITNYDHLILDVTRNDAKSIPDRGDLVIHCRCELVVIIRGVAFECSWELTMIDQFYSPAVLPCFLEQYLCIFPGDWQAWNGRNVPPF